MFIFTFLTLFLLSRSIGTSCSKSSYTFLYFLCYSAFAYQHDHDHHWSAYLFISMESIWCTVLHFFANNNIERIIILFFLRSSRSFPLCNYHLLTVVQLLVHVALLFTFFVGLLLRSPCTYCSFRGSQTLRKYTLLILPSDPFQQKIPLTVLLWFNGTIMSPCDWQSREIQLFSS